MAHSANGSEAMQSFKTTFTLSREYLAECYDQSLPHGKNAKPNFIFPGALLVVGVGLFVYTDQPKMLGSLFIAMAALELLHIRYRRAWWLARQMWGNTANTTVELTIDDNGITAKSTNNETTLLWTDIDRVIDTELGLILVSTSKGQQYLSKATLTQDTVDHLLAKHKESLPEST
jgi:hypothetical protein